MSELTTTTGDDASAETTRGSENIAHHPDVPGKGFRVQDYVIEDILGHGAMATVYLAVDSTGHEVALKVFQEGPGVSATMLERFRREAEASKKLRRHPHIMTIYSTGKEGNYHYIAMESIKRSKTFDAALESTPMSLNQIVEIVVKIARALQYAHSKHIVHRDVKLSNIMIDEFGEPLLSDFGVAELIDWPSCTMTGALTGTPLYMSPEQARGERVGPPSDIYSLGVVLYEAVTGVLPYHAHHRSRVKDVLEAVKTEPPRRPRLFRREITADLEAVMLKALEKSPSDRYPDAEAFAEDLERALAGKRVSAHHFSPLDRLRHQVRRHRQVLTAASIAIVAGVVANAFFSYKLRTARFETILLQAQFRDVEHELQQFTNGRSESRAVPQAWQDIRAGRKAMLSGDWSKGLASFEGAARLSEALGDRRTAAVAQIDQARCLTMLGRRGEAEVVYRAIMQNTDVTPSVIGMAELEYLVLLLLDERRDTALDILVQHGLPSYGPIREAIRCITSDLKTEDLLVQIKSMPRVFRNDAVLAAAVRYHLDKDAGEAKRLLRECIEGSTPSMEWPAPFARKVEADLIN